MEIGSDLGATSGEKDVVDVTMMNVALSLNLLCKMLMHGISLCQPVSTK